MFARKQIEEELMRSKTHKGVMPRYVFDVCLSEDCDPNSSQHRKSEEAKAPFSEERSFEV
jgi:hypothetical protein